MSSLLYTCIFNLPPISNSCPWEPINVFDKKGAKSTNISLNRGATDPNAFSNLSVSDPPSPGMGRFSTGPGILLWLSCSLRLGRFLASLLWPWLPADIAEIGCDCGKPLPSHSNSCSCSVDVMEVSLTDVSWSSIPTTNRYFLHNYNWMNMV